MIPKTVKCPNCNAPQKIYSFRKQVYCQYCGTYFPFEGFDYEKIDYNSSAYATVRYWMDCPKCRSKNMYNRSIFGNWRCPDCNYKMSAFEKQFGVLWFCDKCDTYMNIKKGFTTQNKKWECTECGFVNDVTSKNIF